MTPPREAALLSMVRNAGCAHAHITTETLAQWIDPAFPLHPGFQYLSAVHKCDYLRCYSMHVFGGGYADVKHTTKNWRPFFEALNESAAFGAGYPEVGPHGVARVGGALEAEMQANYGKLVGVCAMIFRRQTIFTKEWYQILLDLLDNNMEALAANPARHPQDRLGAVFTDGTVSAYPLAWTAVGGDIFHPLAYKYSDDILQLDMAPSFENYQ